MHQFVACPSAGLSAGLLAIGPERAQPASTRSVETLLVLTRSQRLQVAGVR